MKHLMLGALSALTLTACQGEVSSFSGEPVTPEGPVTPGDPVTPPDKPPLPMGSEDGLDADKPPPFEEGTCETNQAYFDAKVFDDVMEHWCVGCHNAGGIAASSRLVLEPLLPLTVDAKPPERTPEEESAIRMRNFASALSVARDRSQGVSTLLLKATNRLEHVGGPMIDINSADYRALATFVARANGGAGECAQPATYACDQERPWPGHGRIRRLSHTEYDRTLTDLLGRPVRAGESFVADVESHGYLNSAETLRASPVLLEQWLNTAEVLAQSYITDLDQKLPCASQANRDCARQFVTSFGQRAFRRPLNAQDMSRYMGLYDTTSGHLGFVEGIRDVLTAMLVSPHFLYRFELGTQDPETGVCVLGGYELASELSYLIWGTMPDDTLMEAAARGDLDTPEGLAESARRMIKDPRGAEAFRAFVFSWLHLDRFESVVRDATTYPDFNNDIRERMLQEANDYVREVYNEGQGSLRDLFARTERPMDAMLASYYGAQAPDDGQLHGVELPADRAGILGLGAFLTTHAGGDRSSPVLRGAIVRERLLCQELPPPPPALNVNEGRVDPEWTTRERFAQHSTDPACAGCHRLVDPIGFALEGYNGVGQWRDVYEGTGKPVDVSGAIFASDFSDASVHGLGELTDAIVRGADTPGCFTEQMTRYRYGVSDTFEHGCTVEVLEDKFVQGDLSFETLLVEMTQTSHFRSRAPAHWSQANWYAGERPMAPTTPEPVPVPEPEPEPEPTPDPPPSNITLNDPDLTVMGGPTNDWGAGYCAEYDVLNQGASEVTWRLTMAVEGTINNNWESVTDTMSGTVTFTGAPYNATLAPGAKAHFGFCAQR